MRHTENSDIGNGSEAIRVCEKAKRAIDQMATGDAEIIRMESIPLSSGMTPRKVQTGSIHTKELRTIELQYAEVQLKLWRSESEKLSSKETGSAHSVVY